jgi:hypothetical protein
VVAHGDILRCMVDGTTEERVGQLEGVKRCS